MTNQTTAVEKFTALADHAQRIGPRSHYLLPEEIVIDTIEAPDGHTRGTVVIDGTEFPYYLTEDSDPKVLVREDGTAEVTIVLIADSARFGRTTEGDRIRADLERLHAADAERTAALAEKLAIFQTGAGSE